MQMRSLTVAERGALYSEHVCPFCRSDKFFEGPHGGLSVNWFCARCGAGFNLGPAEYSEFGQLIAEPGPSPDSFQRNNSDAVALHLPSYASQIMAREAAPAGRAATRKYLENLLAPALIGICIALLVVYAMWKPICR